MKIHRRVHADDARCAQELLVVKIFAAQAAAAFGGLGARGGSQAKPKAKEDGEARRDRLAQG